MRCGERSEEDWGRQWYRVGVERACWPQLRISQQGTQAAATGPPDGPWVIHLQASPISIPIKKKCFGPHQSIQDLSPQTRDPAPPPALAAQSLNCWTAREVPSPSFGSQVSKDSSAGPATLVLSYLLPNLSLWRPELEVLTLQVHCQFLLERGSKSSGHLFPLSVETEPFDGLGNPGRAASSYQPLLKVQARNNRSWKTFTIKFQKSGPLSIEKECKP